MTLEQCAFHCRARWRTTGASWLVIDEYLPVRCKTRSPPSRLRSSRHCKNSPVPFCAVRQDCEVYAPSNDAYVHVIISPNQTVTGPLGRTRSISHYQIVNPVNRRRVYTAYHSPPLLIINPCAYDNHHNIVITLIDLRYLVNFSAKAAGGGT